MKYLERNKPVKAVAPAITIARVQDILKNNLHCRAELHECTPPGGIFYSYNLRLHRQNEIHTLFACNGKGVTPALALASAYGELMERLQNLPFYMATVYYSEIENAIHQPSSIEDFQYTRDEQVYSTNELVKQEMPLLRSLFALNHVSRTKLAGYIRDHLKWPMMRCVPFYNFVTGRKHVLPYRFIQWIVGSNGMCVGNTLEEALIQGISEIFERVVLKRIYLQPFTPPDVPIELFSGYVIYDKIKQLEQHECVRIVIKDCSLSIDLPVLGILVFSDNNHTFAFHLGADPCPITALERCFTELFQGGQPVFHSALPIGTEGNTANSTFWRQQLHHSIQSYSGQWPPQLLSNTPNYEFQGFPYCVSNSDHEDLDRLLQLIQKLDYQLLVHDSGFLDFPAYYVYIPGMSEMTNVFDNRFLEQLVNFERQLPLFFMMRSLSAPEQQRLAQHIAVFEEATLSGEFDASNYFRHYPNAPIAQMKGKEIVLALEKGILPRSQPRCFHCVSCSVSDCAFKSMSTLWKTLKNYQ